MYVTLYREANNVPIFWQQKADIYGKPKLYISL